MSARAVSVRRHAVQVPVREVSCIPGRLAALLVVLGGTANAVAADYVAIPGGQFASALSIDGAAVPITLRRFAMRVEPVTNADFLVFVGEHPEWQRGQVSALFAGPAYLSAWRGSRMLGPAALEQQPVTNVSWFAARAFCASEHARLPSWYEWEYVAAADETHRDARQDPTRNQLLLSATLEASGDRPGVIGRYPENFYGVRDLNRLLWEWTGDYGAMFPNADARVAGVDPVLALCGGSALAFSDKNEYALMMDVAALAALKPADDAPRVGFRCVRELPGD